MGDKCEHRLDYEAEMDYWPKDEPCWRCWAKKARPVYDAAMALLAAQEGIMRVFNDEDARWQERYDKLLDACRRAKEGR